MTEPKDPRKRRGIRDADIGIGSTPKAKARQARSMLRRYAAQYDSADCTDGNNRVSFDDFMKYIFPDQDAQTRQTWREICHQEGKIEEDDEITKATFFILALAAISRKFGAGIKMIFTEFDLDHSGMVDEIEFSSCMATMGFGDVASEVFHRHSMPARTRGGEQVYVFSYADVISEVMHMWNGPPAPFLEALSCAGDKKELSVSQFAFSADDSEGVRLQIRRILEEESVRLSDVFQALDDDETFTLSLHEVQGAMKKLGFTGALEVINEMWAAMDSDRSGRITFEEFNCWLHEREVKNTRSSLVDGLSLRQRINLSLDAGGGVWTPQKLKTEMFALLQGAGLQIQDLLLAWCADQAVAQQGRKQSAPGDHMLLSRRQYMASMKKLVGDDELWYEIVREAAGAAFRRMDTSQDGAISRLEMCRYFDPNNVLKAGRSLKNKSGQPEEVAQRRKEKRKLWEPAPLKTPPRYWWPGEPETPRRIHPSQATVHAKGTMCIPVFHSPRSPPASQLSSPQPMLRTPSPRGWNLVRAHVGDGGAALHSTTSLARWKMQQVVKAAQAEKTQRPQHRPPPDMLNLKSNSRPGRRAPPGAPLPYRKMKNLDALTDILIKDLKAAATRAAAPLKMHHVTHAELD